jgi:hypothetical protein
MRLKPACPGCNGDIGWYEDYGIDGPPVWEECPVCSGTGQGSWTEWLWMKAPDWLIDRYIDWQYKRLTRGASR